MSQRTSDSGSDPTVVKLRTTKGRTNHSQGPAVMPSLHTVELSSQVMSALERQLSTQNGKTASLGDKVASSLQEASAAVGALPEGATAAEQHETAEKKFTPESKNFLGKVGDFFKKLKEKGGLFSSAAKLKAGDLKEKVEDLASKIFHGDKTVKYTLQGAQTQDRWDRIMDGIKELAAVAKEPSMKKYATTFPKLAKVVAAASNLVGKIKDKVKGVTVTDVDKTWQKRVGGRKPQSLDLDLTAPGERRRSDTSRITAV